MNEQSKEYQELKSSRNGYRMSLPLIAACAALGIYAGVDLLTGLSITMLVAAGLMDHYATTEMRGIKS